MNVAIIGAGPYGLSLGAHLRAAGVKHRIFGEPMGAWKHAMPVGMLLKSHAWSSCLYDPDAQFTFEAFCAERGVAYHPSLTPLPVETFVAYGEAFQRRLVPDLSRKLLVSLAAAGDGFAATFDDGEVVEAARIVLAVGVHPFKHLPRELDGLSPEALSHSGDHGDLSRFEGRRVVVLGSGASAIDTAALLSERGASVSLVARAPALRFAAPATGARRSLLKRMARPDSGIGPGWMLWAYANAPWLFHALPGPLRRRIVRRTLGPLGGAVMKERVMGKLPLFLGWRVEQTQEIGGEVRLALRHRSGAQQTLAADHVIAATGYRPHLDRLSFLDPALRRRVRAVHGAPVLSSDFESSVPGLHFIGAASADSFGPVVRFVFGAVHPARRLTKVFAKEAHGGRARAQEQGSLAAPERG
ncbi:MAG: NAD(P)/FAD-dependent oxidoreductase [Caulobacteraceae bacterium]|nr:NAD(P)/FAD-dependent oxidoreductase [Caulobacteraceae bacterium]